MNFLSDMPSASEINEQYKVIIDALFGFSFKGNVRAPFDKILETLNAVKVPICAVDVPSGKYYTKLSTFTYIYI